tara:strand:- start:236 stop:964 length:729 start_codon:yes stop_codon:yes gene_type:complete
MTFKKYGFEIVKINKINEIYALRKKFIGIFSTVSKLNNYKIIKNDDDIIRLYKQKKKLWIAAYDQIRLIPETFSFIDKNVCKKVSSVSGIKIPAYTSKPLIRVYMPNNLGTSKTVPHIDYPSHRGSENAVTVWLPLQDLKIGYGTLKVLPGSHKFKTVSGSIMKNSITRLDISSKNYEKKMIDLKVKAGEAIVMSQFLIHSSGDNVSNKIRFSLDFRLNDLGDKTYALRKYYVNQLSYYKKR